MLAQLPLPGADAPVSASSRHPLFTQARCTCSLLEKVFLVTENLLLCKWPISLLDGSVG